MDDFMLKANEMFFDSIFKTLNENGKYGWISEQKFFTKENGKLVADDKEGYELARAIVSPEYFKKRFKLMNYGK
jgi:hypothetical protein